MGVNIEKIAKTTILNKKSMNDIVTALNTTISLGNLIFKITPALLIKEVNPFNTASLNVFIMIIPKSNSIL
jgi:hypothetical protein